MYHKYTYLPYLSTLLVHVGMYPWHEARTTYLNSFPHVFPPSRLPKLQKKEDSDLPVGSILLSCKFIIANLLQLPNCTCATPSFRYHGDHRQHLLPSVTHDSYVKRSSTIAGAVTTHPAFASASAYLTCSGQTIPPHAKHETSQLAEHVAAERLHQRDRHAQSGSAQERAQGHPAVLRQLLPAPSRVTARRVPAEPAAFHPAGNG